MVIIWAVPADNKNQCRSLTREGFLIHPLSHETVVNPPDWHIQIFKFQFKVSLENHKNSFHIISG